MLARGDAEGDVILAGGALEAGVGDLELAEGTGTQGLWLILTLDGLPGNGFHLFLESRWDLVSVLRANQDAGPVEGGLL